MSARIGGSRARCRQASAYEGGTAPTIARMSRSVASRRDLPYDVARDDPACIACRTGGGVFRRPRSARRSRLTWFALSLAAALTQADRKSTRLNSSHGYISYAVFCLKKKKTTSTLA